MSRNDTGIDCSDLLNTIVQCKLRKNTLTWKECSTFFGSQVIFSSDLKKPIIRWDNLIITRNNDCILSENLLERKELFIDIPYNKNELINFCENLIINPPKYPVFNEDFKLRDYQIEAINIIQKNTKNVIINLPTGTGKNLVIIYSMKTDLKYLILVPRIILLDQLKEEIIKHKPKMKGKIQLIGDKNNIFNKNKLITICVFNSVSLIENYCSTFEKIFIDEAHHIYKPSIYYENEEDNNSYEKIKNDSEDNLGDNSEDFSFVNMFPEVIIILIVKY
jgi:type I site-specific restriction endonuclease